MNVPDKYVEYDLFRCDRTGEVLYRAWCNINSSRRGNVCVTMEGAKLSLAKVIEDMAFTSFLP
jgi:hypothetical protein